MGIRTHIYGGRSWDRDRMGNKPERHDGSVIYAAGGWVIWEMTPEIADELAMGVLPFSDQGFTEDAQDLMQASYYAKGNSPEAETMTPPEEMSINERQAWKEGMGHGMFLAELLRSKEEDGT